MRKKKDDINAFTDSDQFIEHARKMGAFLTRKKNSMKISANGASVHVPVKKSLDKHYRKYLIKKFIELGILLLFVYWVYRNFFI